jgi:RNA polymerase sigma-70 factor (ECF subfamily)
MEIRNLDDESLLRLIARSQENALSELYDRYNRLVYSVALNTLGSPEQAEEVTQDVFLRVWRKAATYQPEQGKVITWIASIARNCAIDMLRRQKVRPEGNLIEWGGEEAFDPPTAFDVEGEVETWQSQRRVRQAVAQLPEAQRQALAYAFFQGYSHSEIANLLNEPLGTVKTRIRLAMEKLRQVLREEEPSAG